MASTKPRLRQNITHNGIFRDVSFHRLERDLRKKYIVGFLLGEGTLLSIDKVESDTYFFLFFLKKILKCLCFIFYKPTARTNRFKKTNKSLWK